MRILMLLLCLFLSTSMFSQEMITVEPSGIYKVEAPFFSKTNLDPRIFNLTATDISYDTSLQLYTLDVDGIYKVDLVNGTFDLEYQAGQLVEAVGMTIDADNIFWLAGTYLYTYDPVGKVLTNLGEISERCAGDLTFWNGDLYMATNSDHILKVNRQNPINSTVYMNVTQMHFGLATTWNCVTGQTRTFGYGFGDVVEIDFANQTVQPATNAIIPATGATSPTEWHAALPFHKSIDTIVLSHPHCGQADGAMELVPIASETGALEFSLDGTTWQASGLFTGLSAGLYQVHIRGGACRSITHTVVLNDLNAEPFEAEAVSAASCDVHSGRILVVENPDTEPRTYSLDGAVWQTDSLFTGLASGWYTVTALDENGCRAFSEAYVQDSNNLVVNIVYADSASVCLGETIHISASHVPGGQFTWFENDVVVPDQTTNQLAIAPTDTGYIRYHVSVTNANGCTATTGAVEFHVYNCSLLPNAFTPDGDGVNDSFGMTGIPENWPVDMSIYNRWGQKVFQSSRDQRLWNGEVDEQPAPTDVYVYHILVDHPSGSKLEKKGEVTLLR